MDKVLQQPYCADPEKLKLDEKVQALQEFILTEEKTLHPGKYCIIDGKLFKVV